MASITEFRVRPVERFIVTKYVSAGDAGACQGFGEYPNIEMATAVKSALQLQAGMSATPSDFPPSPPAEIGVAYDHFVVVSREFGIPAMALYAYGNEHAQAMKDYAQTRFGGEWRIFALHATDKD